MSIAWRAAVAGLEAATAVCAALNLAYFLHRALTAELSTRRAAALVLALISLGTLAESAVIMISLEVNGNAPLFVPAAWMVTRATTLAGTGCISALVLRVMGRGK